MRKLPFALAAALTLVLASPALAALITYDVVLAPEAASATGSGTGTVLYDDVARTLTISTTWSGTSGTSTVAHIHCCVATPGTGAAGVAVTPGTLPGFPVGVTSGSYSTVIDLSISGSYTAAFVTANGGTAEGAEAALAGGMDAGRAYLNIHTTTFPSGEIRGFLVRLPEPSAALSFAIGSMLVGGAYRHRSSKITKRGSVSR